MQKMQNTLQNIRSAGHQGNRSEEENQALVNQIEDCIQNCLNSHVTCMDMAMSMVQKGGKADLVRLLLDCSEICQTTAHFLLRGSELQGYVTKACAEISTRCAETCQREGMNDCGNACSATAVSTQQLVKMIAI